MQPQQSGIRPNGEDIDVSDEADTFGGPEDELQPPADMDTGDDEDVRRVKAARTEIEAVVQQEQTALQAALAAMEVVDLALQELVGQGQTRRRCTATWR